MDNVVQNIKLEDIIPSNLQNNNPRKLNELVNSIKKYGIIEPLLVRPKNGKYEIIIGNKRYQAAQIVGIKEVPVLIKNVDDEVFMQYLKINNPTMDTSSNNKFINPVSNINKKENEIQPEKVKNTPPQEQRLNSIDNIKQSRNTDIVNLSELNKEEYERKDFNMNNEQMNNNVMNNMGQTNQMPSMQEPTFGGRFFPSLEDEPTNMNMGNTNINQNFSVPNQSTNNLIDLTDSNTDREINIPNQTNFEMPQPIPASNTPDVMQQPMMNASLNTEPSPEMPSPIPDPMSNIINIGALQNNNPTISQNTMENNMQGIPPMTEQPQSMPQFDMSKNMAPTDFTQNQPINIPQNDFNTIPNNNFVGVEQNQSNYSEPIMPESMPTPDSAMYNVDNFQQANLANNNMPISQKDIIPVVNTIKSLASNLEAFGYKININEEDLVTSFKLTIEIEK